MADTVVQVLPRAMSESYLEGYSQLEGYVIRAADVPPGATPSQTVEAFGYGAVSSAYTDGTVVDVLRFTAGPLQRIKVAYGVTDPATARGDVIVDRPPFTGTGFTASSAAAVPQWRLARGRLPPGTELYRIAADGSEQLLGVYVDVGTGWRGDHVQSEAATALPSHLVGMRARWGGVVYLADLADDGLSVVLASLDETPPPGFERTRSALSRRVVPRDSVDLIDEIVTACRWRGRPFEVVGMSDDWCRLTYTGLNSYEADQLGLDFLQPGVYEVTVPRAELTDVAGVTRELSPPEPRSARPPATTTTGLLPGAGLPDCDIPSGEWTELGDRLAATLRDLDTREYLVISSTSGNAFVQFRQTAETLFAEAAADEYVREDDQLTIQGVAAMHALGWTPPTVNPAGRSNWYIDVPWPASSSTYRGLARASVSALLVRRAADPDELIYKAWRDPEPPPEGVTFHDEDLDPGDPDLDVPSLGLPRRR